MSARRRRGSVMPGCERLAHGGRELESRSGRRLQNRDRLPHRFAQPICFSVPRALQLRDETPDQSLGVDCLVRHT